MNQIPKGKKFTQKLGEKSHKQLVTDYDFLSDMRKHLRSFCQQLLDFVGEPIKASELYEVIADKNVSDI